MTGLEAEPTPPFRAKMLGHPGSSGKPVGALLLVALILTLIPSVALACPACAGNQEGGTAYFVLLGSMILFPFAVAGVTGLVLRQVRLEDE